jgi:predicted amidophosphoribosyltransferase
MAMSVFKRANWHSGLTYRQECEQCKTMVEYMDDKLDFRPWFADGFVYCPTCKKPLRHSERYAINAPVSQQETAQPRVEVPSPAQSELALFCSGCGHKFADGDKFCSQCGAKR